MAFSARARAAIAASYLADLSARYAALGEFLLTAAMSDDEMEAQALAVEIEAIEAMAAAASLDIVPSPDSSAEGLARHGEVEGMAPEPASAALLAVAITGGPISATTGVTGKRVQTATGITYQLVDASGNLLTSITTNGSGVVTTEVFVRCTTLGAAGNLAVAATLTWVSAPTGYGSSVVTVTAQTTLGAPTETFAAYLQRILERRQNRPASGNREDWRDWGKRFAGIEEVFVWPLVSPSLVEDTPGCVYATPVGAAQGDSPIDTRVIDGDTVDAIKAYLEGTGDANGNAVTNGTQLRPVGIRSGAYTIAAAGVNPQHVELIIANNTANAFPWSGRYAKVAAAVGPPETVTIAGDHSALVGLPMLIFVGTAAVRGGFVQATPTAGPYGGVNTVFTFPTGTFLGATPVNDSAGYVLYPAPPNWSAIRTAVFAFFDALGPGNATLAASARYPTEDVTSRSTFYRGALVGAVGKVPGVLNPTIPSTPAGDVTPSIAVRVTLDQLIVRSA